MVWCIVSLDRIELFIHGQRRPKAQIVTRTVVEKSRRYRSKKRIVLIINDLNCETCIFVWGNKKLHLLEEFVLSRVAERITRLDQKWTNSYIVRAIV